MKRILMVAALSGALTLPGAALGQGGGVEECIAQNGPRYSSPSDATTHQYVDSTGLCADAQDDETEVVITPAPGKRPKPRPAAPSAGATPTPAPAVPTPQPETVTPAPRQPKPAAKPRPKPAPKPAAEPSAEAGDARGAAATTAVAAALRQESATAGLSSPGGVASVPGGVMAAVLVGLGLAGAGAGLRRFNRR